MYLLSAVILTLDEERYLGDCLASVRWADEVLVVDSGSQDRTLAIAHEAGARVERHAFKNYAAQRGAALELARGHWVLFVDADERVTTALQEEIKRTLAANPGLVGYWIPRQNLIFGGWVKHAGWYPDRQLRLMRRGSVRYDPTRPVHELVILEGESGQLNEHMVHLNYETPSEFVRKQRLYLSLDAEGLLRRGVRIRPHHAALQPLREFYRRYVSLKGYRDGWRGFLLSALMGWNTFEVYRLALKKTIRGPFAP